MAWMVTLATCLMAATLQARGCPESCPVAVLALVPQPKSVVATGGVCTRDSAVEAIDWTKDASLPAEGYRLTVTPRGVAIASADGAGAFYARQTLKQLARVEKKGGTTAVSYPCVKIEDAPAFKWRGFMLDEGRHFFGREAVKRCLDQMAAHKLNVFHWHLTEDQGWRLALARFPELARYGSVRPDSPAYGSRGLPDRGDCVMTGVPYGPYFYTAEDVRDILAHAQARFITVVPEIEIPGHVQALLAAHPEFSCRGDLPRVPRVHYAISDEVLCAGNDAAIAFMEKVYDEVCALFPGAYIHIGGDECPKTRWKACPKCQARIKALGLKDEEALQGWVTRHFTEYLAKKGRRAIGWDEITAGDPPIETLVQAWRSPRYGVEAAAKGHDIIVSNVRQTYFSVPQGVDDDPFTYLSPDLIVGLEKTFAFNPLEGMTEAARSHVLGAECCMWSECTWNLFDLEWKLFPRICAFAEAVWTAPAAPRDLAGFAARMSVHRRRLIAEHVNCAPLGM